MSMGAGAGAGVIIIGAIIGLANMPESPLPEATAGFEELVSMPYCSSSRLLLSPWAPQLAAIRRESTRQLVKNFMLKEQIWGVFV
jgi:hypothetical protein